MKINDNCIGCSMCVEECAVGAIIADDNYNYKIDQAKCIKCGTCLEICDNGAITDD